MSNCTQEEFLRIKPSDLPNSFRFAIQFLVTDRRVELVIIDQKTKNWGYISPATREEGFNEFLELVGRRISIFDATKLHHIQILGRFHLGFVLPHLAMILYQFGQYYKYDIDTLPRKIVYSEKEFRLFSWCLAMQVQMENCKYNFQHDLVDNQGYFTSEAYISYPSCIGYQKYVVAENMCPFCCSKFNGNLCSHLRMKHGKQGSRAAMSRKY